MNRYIQYGCGLSAPVEWINFDSSPTLRIQKIPILGLILSGISNANFPKNVLYGDIVKGLPLEDESCDGVYCSHVLEHLALDEFRTALLNTHKVLKPGGFFRLVMPDLELLIDSYIANRNNGQKDAAIRFMRSTLVALETRPSGVRGLIESAFGSTRHQWLWDERSTMMELEEIGFTNIRPCTYNDSSDAMFKFVEDEERFQDSIASEMTR